MHKFDTGIGAWICTTLVIWVMRTHWDLRKSPWFWASIVLATILQIPFILLVPWGNRDVTGVSILPVGLLDLGMVYGCVKLAEKMIMTKLD